MNDQTTDISPRIRQVDLDRLFTHHPPTGNQAHRYGLLRSEAKRFAEAIVNLTPEGADQSAAIRKVREAVMTANAAIACGESQ